MLAAALELWRGEAFSNAGEAELITSEAQRLAALRETVICDDVSSTSGSFPPLPSAGAGAFPMRAGRDRFESSASNAGPAAELRRAP